MTTLEFSFHSHCPSQCNNDISALFLILTLKLYLGGDGYKAMQTMKEHDTTQQRQKHIKEIKENTAQCTPLFIVLAQNEFSWNY